MSGTESSALAAGGVEHVPWRVILSLIACVSVFDLTLGMSYPLLSLLLESRGVGAATIGANAAMTPLGLVLSAPLVLPLAQALGAWRLALACMATTAAALLGFKLSDDLAAWFALRFLLGVAIGTLFAISEAWITKLASGRWRGRIIGLYASLLSLGFALGPLMLPVTGIEGWPPFIVGLAFIGLGAIPLLLSRHAPLSFAGEERGSIRGFARQAPLLLTAVAVFAMFDTAAMSLLPLYGLRHGLSQAEASQALGVLIIGNVVLQPMVGWLLDRCGWFAMMLAASLLTVAGALVLPLAVGSPWLWPLLFFWGTTGFSVYTVALAELGARFSGATLVAGAAAFSAMWGFGGIFGPPLGGAAMEHLGPDGLPLLVAASFTLLVAAILWPPLRTRLRR